MPSRQVRPVDTGGILRAQQAQIVKLQTFPPAGLTLLGSFGPIGAFSGQTWYGGPGFQPIVSSGYLILFTLQRPQPIMVMGSMGGFSATGGTSPSVNVAAYVGVVGNSQPALDVISGRQARAAQSYQIVGQTISNASAAFCVTLAAGSYYATWGYVQNGGATTTFGFLDADLAAFAVAG